jgi:hypothetical protein
MTLDDLHYIIEDETIPYKELKIDDNIVIRYFSANTPEHLLKWHWDEEDRIVEALNTNDWKFQFDNQIPVKFSDKASIEIKKDEYHRIIKGTTDLILKINKII